MDEGQCTRVNSVEKLNLLLPLALQKETLLYTY